MIFAHPACADAHQKRVRRNVRERFPIPSEGKPLYSWRGRMIVRSHVGGIMSADGSRNFPNAQIHIAQADLEFWTDDKRLGTPAEGSALAAKKNLLPNRDRIVFYKDGQEVIPGVQAMQKASAHRPPSMPTWTVPEIDWHSSCGKMRE
jgi:hypothetical protein